MSSKKGSHECKSKHHCSLVASVDEVITFLFLSCLSVCLIASKIIPKVMSRFSQNSGDRKNMRQGRSHRLYKAIGREISHVHICQELNYLFLSSEAILKIRDNCNSFTAIPIPKFNKRHLRRLKH